MKEYINEIIPLFEKVGEKIGEGAEFSWATILKQQIIHGVGDLMFSILLLVVLVVTGIVLKTYTKKMLDEGGDGFPYVLGWLVWVGFFLFLCADLYCGIAHLINPEYYAINYLVNLVQ